MRAAWWEKIHLEAEPELPAKSYSPARAAFLAIISGGSIAGVCDLTYAIVFYAAQGVKPIRVFQSIASGLLGMNSYEGGWATAALGIALHFAIALTAAAVYYWSSRKIELLVRSAPICGMVYGAAVYFFMRWVVIPLSAAPPFNPGWLAISTDLAVHVFLIGLPIALMVRHYSQPVSEKS
jgi:hypothetical protein